MRREIALAALWVTLVSLAPAAPNTMTYQGSLLRGDGTPVGNGNYSMRFSVYGTATGDSALWQETDTNVAVMNGLFSTSLGDGIPLGTLFALYSNLWLEIAIDLDKSGTFTASEIYTPRQKVASAPWAMDADTLDGKHVAQLGDIMGVTAGTGLLGGGTSGSVTLSADTAYLQRRVTGTAPAGQFIRAINANGTVVAAADQTGNDWHITGNIGTTSGTHFLGTRDYAALDLRTSNTRALRLEPALDLAGRPAPNVIGGAETNAVGPRTFAAAVGGGYQNTASDRYATVAGGGGNTASGAYSFAAGCYARANRDGCFVWADDTNAGIYAAGDDRFIVRANGGIWLGRATVDTSASIPAGRFINTSTGGCLSNAGNWVDFSDRNAKENFKAVDGQEVLSRLAQMPVTQWNYKVEGDGIQHIGPVAQDFYAIFGLGQDDRHIAPLDANGVALAAIQGLYQMLQEKDAEIRQLKADMAEMKTLLAKTANRQSP